MAPLYGNQNEDHLLLILSRFVWLTNEICENEAGLKQLLSSTGIYGSVSLH